jgi:hypothetical protein
MLWSLALDHPELGSATLACDRSTPPATDYVRFAANLSGAERAAATDAASSVVLSVPAKRRSVLRDRKTLLRIARDVLGDDGVIVLDVASQLPWSRAALEDELAHDADLDIEALYCLHAVHEGDGEDDEEPGGDETAPTWLHTHGLGELGAFDVDIVRPHPGFLPGSGDLFRALATRALEGDISPDEGRFQFGHPGGFARLVPADRFGREADPAFGAARDADDHLERRSVLCEPVGGGLFGLRRRDRPEPLRFARRPVPDPFVVFFPDSLTELSAERARATVGVLRGLFAEFAEFEVVAIVKLGYPTRDGKREHLWFQAHGFGGGTVDATLESRPYGVDLRPGERADSPLELLTDWTLITPAGWITPRSQAAARRLREDADEIRAAMRAGRPTG